MAGILRCRCKLIKNLEYNFTNKNIQLPNRHVAHLFADDLLNLFRSFIPIFLKRGYYEPDINNIIARAAKETTLTKYRIVEELHYTYAIKRS